MKALVEGHQHIGTLDEAHQKLGNYRGGGRGDEGLLTGDDGHVALGHRQASGVNVTGHQGAADGVQVALGELHVHVEARAAHSIVCPFAKQ